MSTSNFITKTALAAILLFCPLAYSQQLTQTDSDILSAVHSNYSANKTTAGLKIRVSSQNGIVGLSGDVDTDAEASKLVEIAESVPGVKDVDTSHLHVKKSNQPFADTAITAKVKGTFTREKLFGNTDIPLTNIKVETTNGIVYLTGTVETQEQAETAVTLTKSISGVKDVVSKLEVNQLK